MPSYAFLRTELNCPLCSAPVADELWFQWGFCGGRAPWPESTYKIGNAIRWRRCADGSVPAWTYFIRDEREDGGNIGSIEVRDIVVRDLAQYWLHETCSACGEPLGGGVVEIRSGRIVRGWLAQRDEFEGDAQYWLPSPDGLKAAGWDDHQMELINCHPWEITTSA